jgi:hypothetical protein
MLTSLHFKEPAITKIFFKPHVNHKAKPLNRKLKNNNKAEI